METSIPAGSQKFPSRFRAIFALIVLFLIAIVTAMDTSIGKLVIEPMKRELPLDDLEAGLVNVTAYSVAYGLVAVPAGILADRVSRIFLLMISVLSLCLSLAIVGLSHSLWALVLGKMMFGAASGLAYPAALSLFSDFFSPEQRAPATNTYPVGQALGGAGAVWIGGVGFTVLTTVASDTGGLPLGIAPWRAVSLLFGAASAVLFPLLLLIREPVRQEVLQEAGGDLRDLWTYRSYLIPLFLGMMFLTGASSVNVWIFPALTRIYGQQPGDYAGWLSGVTLIAGLLGVSLSGWLMQLGRKRGGLKGMMTPATLATAIVAASTFMAAAPNVPTLAAIFALALIAGSVAICGPVISLNFRVPNELRGTATGLSVVLLALCSGASAPLVGWVSGALGGDRMIGLAMGLVGCPLGLAGALCLALAARNIDLGPPIPGQTATNSQRDQLSHRKSSATS